MKTSPHPGRGRQQGSWSQRSVDLKIEELVLHGFPPSERHRIAAAVEEELSRLIRKRGLPESLGDARSVARLDAGAIYISAGAPARTTGAGVGAALYKSMQKGSPVPRQRRS